MGLLRTVGGTLADIRNAMSDESSKILARADSARDARDWKLARTLYREFLEHQPGNAAIWVQYGHACKEFGDIGAAKIAYCQSIKQAPETPDTYLQLGHVLKILRRSLPGQERIRLCGQARSIQ